jgi:fucose permease
LKKNNLKNYLLEFPNFLSLFLFAFFMTLASPILVDMGKFFNVLPENMNLIVTFFMIGELAGILALIFLIRRFNGRKVIIWSYAALIPVLVGVFLAESLILFYLLYFITGCLLGAIFMDANLDMLEGKVENKDSVVNLGHGFFAIGALASPFIVSVLVNRQISWRYIYLIVIILSTISLAMRLFMYKRMQVEDPAKKIVISLKETFKSKNKNIYMLLTSILMLFYVMSEVTIFSWSPTFFRVEKLFNIFNAGLVVSVFWIGILAGRLIISVLSYRIKAGTLLIILSLISISGLAIAIFPIIQSINIIGAAIMGLGFSGIPPLLISSASRIFGAGKDISLTILFVIGIAGGSIIPFLIKILANYSFLFSLLIALIFMAAFLIFVLVRRNFRKTIHDKDQN